MIAIQIQDEDGRVESEFDDPQAIYPLLTHGSAKTACLRFIDPHGDTTFNRHQVACLVEELEDAAGTLGDSTDRRRAAALIEFLRPVVGAIHMYVKFVGD